MCVCVCVCVCVLTVVIVKSILGEYGYLALVYLFVLDIIIKGICCECEQLDHQ